MNKKLSKAPKIIDLFSGCGGLSFGFMNAGYDVVLGIDNWPESLETFKNNHPGAQSFVADLSSMNPKEINQKFGINPGDIDVVVGGPPCQGFSISGKRDIDDPRNKLYKGFVKFVEYYHPKAFLLENVPNLASLGGGIIKDKIVNDFSNMGYNVAYKVLRASDYGVPQHRRRIVFIGLRNGEEFKFPEPTHGDEAMNFVSSGNAISDLPEHSIADGQPNNRAPVSSYQKEMRIKENRIFNHQATDHTEKTVQIISLVPDGGNYKNLPEELQKSRNVHIAWTRLNSAKPSFTIDTGHRHHFHYKYNRIPTVRESARIQSFPDDFVFYGSKTSQYKQVGNAVPPLMAAAIANKLLEYL